MERSAVKPVAFFYARMFSRKTQKYIFDEARSIHLMRPEAISEGVRSHL